MKKYILLFLLILCASCNRHTISEGVVAEKHYTPSSTILVPMPAGKILISVPRTIPEKYCVIIYKDSLSDKYEVSKKDYESIKIGQYIKFE